jgi:hypothetical protein
MSYIGVGRSRCYCRERQRLLPRWLKQNREVAVRFTRAYHNATQWVLDPANREEALSLLVTPMIPRAVAEQIYEKQIPEGVGLIPALSIEQEALYNVLALRQEFGGRAGRRG